MNYKEKINSKEYDFLRTDPHLGNRIMLLTLGGSHAYGTNNENSDLDIRGITAEFPNELIGRSNFEQVINHETDTTIYAFNKMITLLSNCNPNTIEILGTEKDELFIVNELGQMLLDNKKIFLSKQANFTFRGYATAQLRRLENALSNNYEDKRQKHLTETLNNQILQFGYKTENNDLTDYIKFFYDEKTNSTTADFHLNSYNINELTQILNEITNTITTYGKMNHRNSKKDFNHLCKHSMHLIRLYLMALDILEKEEINTKRKNDLQLLLDIRNGKYMKSENEISPEFFEILNDLDKKLEYAFENSSLPERPNFKLIEELTMEINKKIILAN